MANYDGNIEADPDWVDVPLLSTTALARGGPTGPLNAQAIALYRRTQFLKNSMDAQAVAGGKNLLSMVPPAEWAGILAGTSSYDVSAALNSAFVAGHWFMPRGRWRITRKVTLQRNASLSCSPGANLVCDFTSPATWGSDFRGLVVAGLGNADVGSDTQTRMIENLLVTSVNGSAVQATAIAVPNGATGPGVLQSAYQVTMRNIMVDGFDRAYYFGQLRESELWGLKARNVRVGIEIRGRCIGTRFYGTNLFRGTPVTSSGAGSYGVIVNSYNIGGADRGSGSEERPEDSNFFGGAIVGFDTNIDAVRGLLVKLDALTLDSPSVNVSQSVVDGLTITRCWIASAQGTGKGVLLSAVASPAAAPLVRIQNNEFNTLTNGVEAVGRDNIRVLDNKFDGSTGYDVFFSANVSSSKILNNKSKSSPAVSIQVNACAELDIDGNTSDGAVCVYVHPSNANVSPPTANSLRIGKNTGSTHRTYERGSITIPAGATSATLTLTKWSVSSYLAPRVRVVQTQKNVGYVNVREVSTFATYEFSIAAAAPTDGVKIFYEVEAIWFGDL